MIEAVSTVSFKPVKSVDERIVDKLSRGVCSREKRCWNLAAKFMLKILALAAHVTSKFRRASIFHFATPSPTTSYDYTAPTPNIRRISIQAL